MNRFANFIFIVSTIFVALIIFLLGSILIKEMNHYINEVGMGKSIVKISEEVAQMIWISIALTFVLLMILLIVMNNHIFEKYIKPIRNVSKVAEKLAEGKFNTRTHENYYGEAEKLGATINLLARNLQRLHIETEMQHSRLKAVIDNMNSGIMLINEKGFIELINPTIREYFGGEEKSYIGYLYYEAIPQEEVHNAIRDVFMLEDNVQKTFIIEKGIDRLFIAFSGVPIYNKQQKWKGAVIVFHNITEIKKLEEMRKDFVANVSHELKTPITSIKGFAETLLEGAKNDETTLTQFLQIIHKESTRMQNLIQDLLELSKIEKEDYCLKIEDISLAEIIKDVIHSVEYLTKDKNIKLTANIKKAIHIQGERGRIFQLLLNLVANAIYYTPAGGEVKVIVEDAEEKVKLIVSDTGIGIPKNLIPRIFERFYRVDKARSRNSGGTGLGLAIVKHIVEAHHGRIEVQSEVDKGTDFIVYLNKKL
jgi:two-component system, OmpR family, phosphate regulon sensor histidine kinase PhoR